MGGVGEEGVEGVQVRRAAEAVVVPKTEVGVVVASRVRV